MSKKLVAYFSASEGQLTKKVAEKLANKTGADLYEIRPEIPYTAADLDWKDENSRTTEEKNDRSIRPALADKDAHIENYNEIILGFPIWWYVAPNIINTFLEAYDFSGKTIKLFATSGGSDFGKTVEALKPSVSDTTVIKQGKVLNGKLPCGYAKFYQD